MSFGPHTKETLVLKVSQDSEHWVRVSNNLSVFFKSYVCAALLGVKELTYCGKCDKVLLEECEIMSNEQNELSSICRDQCGCWFHFRCENIISKDMADNVDWVCSQCVSSAADLIRSDDIQVMD